MVTRCRFTVEVRIFVCASSWSHSCIWDRRTSCDACTVLSSLRNHLVMLLMSSRYFWTLFFHTMRCSRSIHIVLSRWNNPFSSFTRVSTLVNRQRLLTSLSMEKKENDLTSADTLSNNTTKWIPGRTGKPISVSYVSKVHLHIPLFRGDTNRNWPALITPNPPYHITTLPGIKTKKWKQSN